MPRARAQRGGTRKKPKAPEGREGEGLSLEERKDKLEFFKKDFEMQVQARLERMEKEKEELLSFIQETFDRRLAQIPKAVRDMKVKDFMAAGGTIELALASLTSCNTLLPPPSTLHTRFKSRTQNILNQIPEEPSESETENSRRTGRGGRKTAKRSQSARPALRDSANIPQSSRTTRYRTPANRRLNSMGLDTPLITPKFDPRLPMTPGQGRCPKPGEPLMSLAGSPIVNPFDQEHSHRSTIRKQGRTLTVTMDLEGGVDGVQMEGVSQADIKQMLGIFTCISRSTK